MSYFAPYIDASGLHLPTYHDILDSMIEEMKGIYGADIYLENDSADYQFLSILALKIADSYQAVQYAYNSRSPQTAIGAALDAVVKLNGLRRKEAGHSTAEVTLKGTPFTEIKNGVVSDVSNAEWLLPKSVIIGDSGSVTVSAVCREAGAISAERGTIKKIVTPTYGWISVNNEKNAVPGVSIETDGELRQRQTISTANPSQTMLEGTLGSILSVDNVTRAVVYENDTNSAERNAETNPHGLPPHSITCVVEGGQDDEIAKAILYHKGIGCYTNGKKEIYLKDKNGYTNTVRFTRPSYITVKVEVKLSRYTGYITSITESVKQAVYNYLSSLAIGHSVSISMMMGEIMKVNPHPERPIFGVSSLYVYRGSKRTAFEDVAVDYGEVVRPDWGSIEVTA